MKLSELTIGVRFVLLRTGTRYEVVSRRSGYHVNVRRADGTQKWLHHACFVKPIVKAGGAAC